MLEFLKYCGSPYAVSPQEETWGAMEGASSLSILKTLSPVGRLLLTSDGSMTQMLEALLLKKISTEIICQKIAPLEKEVDAVCEFVPGSELLAREAWLIDGERPLVYAYSLLSVPEEGDYSLQAIKEVNEPLGRMVRDNGVRTLRDRCCFGLVSSPSIAEQYGVGPEADLWARYYRLTTDSNFSGVIFELFSPSLFEI